MRLTIYNKDWLIVDEVNIDQLKENYKVHLIKLNFDNPTEDKIKEVFDRFPSTNRYVVEDNIKFYNDILRNNKKYYVENRYNHGLITFFKKNNKVMLNYIRLEPDEKEFVQHNINDILKNIEVLYLGDRKILDESWTDALKFWNGNILVDK